MKKSIVFFPFVFIVILVVIFSSVFLPHIKLGITIQTQYQSTVRAGEPDNLAQAKAHCLVLSDWETDKISNEINTYYNKGYRLKNFSATYKTDTNNFAYFAAVCKE